MSALHRTASARGRPLFVFTAVLGGWLALRVLLWQSPFPEISAHRFFAEAASATTPHRAATASPWKTPQGFHPLVRILLPKPGNVPNNRRLAGRERPPDSGIASANRLVTLTAKGIVGQNLLLAAAFSHMKLAPAIVAYFSAAVPGSSASPSLAERTPPPGRPVAPPGVSRWSGDGWLLLRRDSAGPFAAGAPSYGRSQMGAVLRYRLAPSSAHRPVAYVRASRTLAGPDETEVAVGLAARPVARLPLSVAAEVRAFDSPAGQEMRPAAFAVTELPPVKLPLDMRGEAYVQAGYVGGDFATAFVDGQARVDKGVARWADEGELRAGAGVWGGAQKHAGRLDVGPSATLGFRLGETRSRLAVDYRVRVAGDARPKSGPAVTISAGF
jgi:hypothetical protein